MDITVVDDVAGVGKTSCAINMMNDNSNDSLNYIYVSPFLLEVQRVVESVDNRNFYEPKHLGYGKLENVKTLLINGENIATTHNLLRYIDQETIDLIKNGNYHLILDEVLEVLVHIPVSADDTRMLLNEDFIRVELFDNLGDSGTVVVNEDKQYTGAFSEFIDMVRTGRVVCSKQEFFVWCFPIEAFEAFSKSYIFTYMFEGSFMRSYFDINNVTYDKGSIDSEYNIIPYRHPDISRYKDLVNIIDKPNLNSIGDDRTALSVSWYRSKTKNNVLFKKLKSNLNNYYKNVTNAKSNDFLWTTYKDYRINLASNGFRRPNTFCAHNARATNNYRHKTTLAYTVNRFINPYLGKYIRRMDSNFNEDAYALSELIQWLFRSGIRDDKEVTLYIPSRRMRELLIKWLKGE